VTASLPLVALATTPTALNTLLPVCVAVQAELWFPAKLTASVQSPGGVALRPYQGPLRQILTSLWRERSGLIFGLATGAVVRLIAPLLQDKATDPAVVVVDEAGTVVISLCGGHQGGADRLAQEVAQYLQATPVLTGAANYRALPGIDVLGHPFGWRRGQGDWTGISAVMAQGQPVAIVQEAGTTLWQRQLPANHPFQWQDSTVPQAQVWISPRQRDLSGTAWPQGQWHPRLLWVGVGCERGTAKALIARAIQQVFEHHGLAVDAIAGLASLDLKADEPGLVALCQERHWPLRLFSPEHLSTFEVPHPSAVVAQAVGTPSVAEAAALAAALAASPGAAMPSLLVAKQVWRQPDLAGAVTLAIAPAEREYTGRQGHLALVGIGPGRLDQLTPAAKGALSRADVVIGYGLYVDLIRPLLPPGQIVETLPITQERQRAQRAIELAFWGLSVAVISSGDCGIYGMAGLVLEHLEGHSWDGQTPAVTVYPGITALQAAAARVGAPLMHDFCAISLSDLLTPLAVIEQRLTAAAAADFVVALYNPQSQRRTEPLALAHRIFLAHRPSTTPVAIVRAAYRPEETVICTSLERLLDYPIDMVTVVLIGNRTSYMHQGWMITPRGYY